MNTRAAIVSLLLVLVLAGAAVVLLRPTPPPPGPTPTWLVTLDSAPVERLEFRRGEAIAAEVLRRDGAWLMRTPDGAQPDWPVDESHVRGLLRLLASTAAAAGSATDQRFEESLTIVTGAGERRTLSARVEPVGGVGTLITRDDPAGKSIARTIDPGLADSLQSANVVASWRRPSAFPSDTASISRVRVESAGLLLEIARVKGVWNVLLPFPTPGAADACNALATTLTQLAAERLIGRPDTQAATWARSPVAFFELELVEPGEGRRRLIQELRVGGAADGAGKTLLALAEAHWLETTTNVKTPAWGPMVLTVRRETIEAVHPDLAAFAARESVQVPPADIAGVWLASPGSPDALDAQRTLTPPRKDALATSEFARARLVRTIEGWRKITVGTTGAVLSDAESALLPSLIKVVCEQPAAGIFAERPKDSVCVGAIVFTDPAGGPVAIIGLGVVNAGGGGPPSLVVRSGRLWRVYAAKEAGALAARVAELVKDEG